MIQQGRWIHTDLQHTDRASRDQVRESGGVHIAYQVFGEGEIDLVLVPGFTTHIELPGSSSSRAMTIPSSTRALTSGSVKYRSSQFNGREVKSIAPELAPGDAPGGYDIYGPRVPGIVVSPYSKPNAVTNVVHDHTSALATIEAKWNLPALTYRDANASTVMDFLDLGQAAFLAPPTIAAPPVPVEATTTT